MQENMERLSELANPLGSHPSRRARLPSPSSEEAFRTSHPSIERGIGWPRSIGPHSLLLRWPQDKPLTCSH